MARRQPATAAALTGALAVMLSLALVAPAAADSAAPAAGAGTPSPVAGTAGAARPAPSASPSATGTQGPVDPALPANDGVAPAAGTVDQYLALTAERDPAARAVDDATVAYAATHATLVRSQQQLALLVIARQQLQAVSAQARLVTDQVANALYQTGDSGLGPIIQIMSVGPDGFIESVDNAFKARRASNAVVYRAIRANADVVFAQGVEGQVRATVATQKKADDAAAAALASARADLASIDGQLGSLAIAAPTLPLDADGCPTLTVPVAMRDGSASVGAHTLCHDAVVHAPTPQAALAIAWAFRHLGAAYACGGAGRMLPFRADCSSFVSRAYHEGAGLGTATASDAPSTRDMVPWGGASLDPHYALVAPADLQPGDLVLYDTCPQPGCAYRHVVMYLGSTDGGRTQWMVHTNACGDVAHVSRFWGVTGSSAPFLVARRVVPVKGEKVHVAPPSWTKAHPAPAPAA